MKMNKPSFDNLNFNLPKKRSEYVVEIVADSNDGDYITTKQSYDEKTFKQIIVHEIEYVMKNHKKPYELKEYYFDDFYKKYLERENYSEKDVEEEYIDELSIPFDGYDGNCHSLTQITIWYIDSDGITWEVNLKE